MRFDGIKRILLIALLISSLLCQDFSTLQQVVPTSNPQMGLRSNSIDIKKLSEKQSDSQSQQFQKLTDKIPLEGVVNDSLYLIGPSDLISISFTSFGDENPTTHLLYVNPDGSLVIPGFGTVIVARMTLAEAKNIITDKIKERIRTDEIAVNLSGTRQFRVHVTGYIALPGAYNVTSSYRVAELIKLSGGYLPSADLSTVMISRGYDTLLCNLTKYFIDGDLINNPYLIDGDVVNIPRKDISDGHIYISGGVTNNGLYPIKNGTTLEYIIPNIIDPEVNTDLTRITLIRDNKSEQLNYSTEDKNVELKHNDRLIVPMLSDSVYVSGYVKAGGAFPYIPYSDYSTYVAMAGGPTDKGSSNSIVIYRNGVKLNNNNIIIEPGDVIFLKPSKTHNLLNIVQFLYQTATIVLTIYTIGKNK